MGYEYTCRVGFVLGIYPLFYLQPLGETLLRRLTRIVIVRGPKQKTALVFADLHDHTATIPECFSKQAVTIEAISTE